MKLHDSASSAPGFSDLRGHFFSPFFAVFRRFVVLAALRSNLVFQAANPSTAKK